MTQQLACQLFNNLHVNCSTIHQRSFTRNCFWHFSIFLVQIFKVNKHVSFTDNYLTENILYGPENTEICWANFEISPPNFFAGSTRKSPLIMCAMDYNDYPENLKPKYRIISVITLHITFLVKRKRIDMSIFEEFACQLLGHVRHSKEHFHRFSLSIVFYFSDLIVWYSWPIFQIVL